MLVWGHFPTGKVPLHEPIKRNELARRTRTGHGAAATADAIPRPRNRRCDSADQRGRGQGAPGFEQHVVDQHLDIRREDVRRDDIVERRHDHDHGFGDVHGWHVAGHDHDEDLDHHHCTDYDDHHDQGGNDLGRIVAMTSTVATYGPAPSLVSRSLSAIGTTATVVVQDPPRAEMAERILRAELAAIDEACSRFRSDSELQMVHAQAGRTVRVSALLFEALDVAYSVAERTHGAVDPTVGNAIATLGYDRDLEQVSERPPVPAEALGPVAGFMHVQLNRRQRTVRIPRGVRLDLGSSAKALVADRAATRIAGALGSGVLVNIGGDVAVAGLAPVDGWPVGIAVESSTPVDEVDQVVSVRHGGLASSSTSVRTWIAGARTVHHIIDPRTGDCVRPYWTLVSATGASCVDANALATASLIWGDRALLHLAEFDQAVRLVRHDGQRFFVGGWPGQASA
jgi:FAD:protein FMN transferase